METVPVLEKVKVLLIALALCVVIILANVVVYTMNHPMQGNPL